MSANLSLFSPTPSPSPYSPSSSSSHSTECQSMIRCPRKPIYRQMTNDLHHHHSQHLDGDLELPSSPPIQDENNYCTIAHPRQDEDFRSASQNTLSRTLSSPDVLLNVPMNINYYPSSSSTPSPMPNGDLSTILISPPTPLNRSKAHLFSSMESLASSSTNARNTKKRSTLLERPQNVGRTLQRTHSHLKRTRLLHCFYLLALPVYTLFGAFIFQALDGAHDDYLMKLYDMRCREEREERLKLLRETCLRNSTVNCFDLMSDFLAEIETCYRKWHSVNKTMTHPMSDFTNAVIYAFRHLWQITQAEKDIYPFTTCQPQIILGTISASSVPARIATVIYGTFGIPLFFAFIKEEGNQCRVLFIWMYNWVKEWLRKGACKKFKLHRRTESDKLPQKDDSTAPLTLSNGTIGAEIKADRSIMAITMEQELTKHTFIRKSATAEGHIPMPQIDQTKGKLAKNSRQKNATEQRRVFFCGVLIFIVYLFAISGLFAIMADWDYFTAFYFLFNSVALIGFGDVFPSQARIILLNMFFIVMGVVLFSMCYFILQEEIRVKAFEASRKARMSISKYSHSLMLHTKNPWSRRNSPAFNSPGFDRSPFSDGSGASGSTFDRLRKRRQSAPVITVANGSRKSSKAEPNRRPV